MCVEPFAPVGDFVQISSFIERPRSDAERFIEVDQSPDRKSTRLNSSHGYISYAVFCLKKKKNTKYSATTLSSILSAPVVFTSAVQPQCLYSRGLPDSGTSSPLVRRRSVDAAISYARSE